jgi:alkyl sulfatase BDS1-like metallo-beta-lactamase superfamily hydrolase
MASASASASQSSHNIQHTLPYHDVHAFPDVDPVFIDHEENLEIKRQDGKRIIWRISQDLLINGQAEADAEAEVECKATEEKQDQDQDQGQVKVKATAGSKIVDRSHLARVIHAYIVMPY